MEDYTCVFCRTAIGEETRHPELCEDCDRLMKKAEKEEKLDYLFDG